MKLTVLCFINCSLDDLTKFAPYRNVTSFIWLKSICDKEVENEISKMKALKRLTTPNCCFNCTVPELKEIAILPENCSCDNGKNPIPKNFPLLVWLQMFGGRLCLGGLSVIGLGIGIGVMTYLGFIVKFF